MQKLFEKAKNEVGYHDVNGISKYYTDLFPNQRPLPWCLVFIEWLFIQAYGADDAIKMLYLINGKFVTSVPSMVTYIKQAKKWHSRMIKPGWLLFLRMGNEWTNHVELIIGTTKSEIISIGGNCGGEVKLNTFDRNDIRISGFGEPNYSILENHENSKRRNTIED